jgi:hypothetical protein
MQRTQASNGTPQHDPDYTYWIMYRTGEALSIAAKKAAVFKPGKELSALLNTSAEEPDAQAKAVEQRV